MTQELRDYLKEIREGQGLSLRKAGELCGISHSEIRRIENGSRQEISMIHLRKLADGYQIPYFRLMKLGKYM